MRKFITKHRLAIAVVVLTVAAAAIMIVNLSRQQAQVTSQAEAKSATDLKTLKQKLAATKRARAEAKAKAANKAAEKARVTAPVRASSSGKECLPNPGHDDPTKLTVVVNKKHCIEPLKFAPNDLVSLTAGRTVKISAPVKQAFLKLRAAAKTDGIIINVTSGFRSYQTQVATYNYWVKVDGSRAAADRVSARPGHSEHQTGLSLDLSTVINGKTYVLEQFGKQPAYSWMKAHAADYGFIERYPAGDTSFTGYSPEPWHWRYVGKNIAKAYLASGADTLEQYWGVSGGDYNY